MSDPKRSGRTALVPSVSSFTESKGFSPDQFPEVQPGATIQLPSGSSTSGFTLNVEETFNSGTFAVVFKAIHMQTGRRVVVKKVLQDPRFKNRELSITKKLHHPNIIRLYKSFYTSASQRGEVYLNLVLEFWPSSLYEALYRMHQKGRKMSSNSIRYLMFQVFRALAYIHSIGVCHRDIKPENILINPHSLTACVCDFGSSKVLEPGVGNVSYICSRFYRAPELLMNSEHYGHAIDVWAAGCVLAECYLGKAPFQGDSTVSQLMDIIQVLGSPSQHEIVAMNPDASQHAGPLSQMRGSGIEALMKGLAPPDALDLLTAIFRYDPTERLSAVQVLQHPFFQPIFDMAPPVSSRKLIRGLYVYDANEADSFGETLCTKATAMKRFLDPNLAAEIPIYGQGGSTKFEADSTVSRPSSDVSDTETIHRSIRSRSIAHRRGQGLRHFSTRKRSRSLTIISASRSQAKDVHGASTQ